MKKTWLILAGSALVLAAPAMASTAVIGPFKNRGECTSMLHWVSNSARMGWTDGWAPGWLEVFGGDLECMQRNGGWWVVTA